MNRNNLLFCYLMLIIVVIVILVIIKLILLFGNYARNKMGKYLSELHADASPQKEKTSLNQLGEIVSMETKNKGKNNSVVVVGYNFYPSEITNDDAETTILGVFTSVELAQKFIKEWIKNNEISDGMEFFDEIHQLNPED